MKKSLFAHGEHIFDGGDYIFSVVEYIISVGEQNRIHLFFHFFYRKAFFCINQASKNCSKNQNQIFSIYSTSYKIITSKNRQFNPFKTRKFGSNLTIGPKYASFGGVKIGEK